MPQKQVTEHLSAFGHVNIKATHRSTLEFTKDKYLSSDGDCIVATGSDKSVADFSHEFVECLKKTSGRLTVRIEVGDLVEEIHAYGSPQLVLSHPTDIVVRKSDYICSRTLAVRADKTAADISRRLVEKLKDPNQHVKITLTTKC
jgi:hypothetical protein